MAGFYKLLSLSLSLRFLSIHFINTKRKRKKNYSSL
ncbi:unnamed protein product [Arabidopsis halleri]